MPAFTSHEQVCGLQFCMLLADVATVEKRCAFLTNDPETRSREIVSLKHSPRVHVDDFGPNNDILEACILLSRDDWFSSVPITSIAFAELDKNKHYRLSMQSSSELRFNWARWEADKLRLVFAYLQRQHKRSPSGGDAYGLRLKTLLHQRTRNLLASTPLALVAPGTPTIPALRDASCSGCAAPAPAQPAAPLALRDVGIDIFASLPAFPLLAGDDDEAGDESEPRDPDVMSIASSPSPLPDEDGYFPLDPTGHFFEPLPPSLDVGLKKHLANASDAAGDVTTTILL